MRQARIREAYKKSLDYKAIVDLLEESGAMDILAFDVRGMTDLADYVIICTSRSEKHSQGIWNRIEKFLPANVQVRSVEGYRTGFWVLVDMYDIILHILTKSARDFYKLEDLWFSAKKLYPKERGRRAQKR